MSNEKNMTMSAADAFVLEQPDGDFNSRFIQDMASMLEPNTLYQPIYMEGDNSAVLVFMKAAVLDNMTPGEETALRDKFSARVKKLINGIAECDTGNYVFTTIAGIRTCILRGERYMKENLWAYHKSGEWILRDANLTRYVRVISEHEFELVGIMDDPVDFCVCHGKIDVNDFSEEEIEAALEEGGYGKNELDAIGQKYGEWAANLFLAENELLNTFTDYHDEGFDLFDTFREAEARVLEIVGKGYSQFVQDYLSLVKENCDPYPYAKTPSEEDIAAITAQMSNDPTLDIHEACCSVLGAMKA